ncbi:MAG: class I SAM-dependent methyltransferase [Patescibacteria group bacterium]
MNINNQIPSPFYLVKKFLSKIKNGVVLDIGSGNGRNSFFLAQNNFRVEALDINTQNVKNLKILSKQLNLNIKTKQLDVKKFKFQPRKYDLILAIQSLIWMKKTEFIKIIKKIKDSLKPEGIAIISGFTIEDMSYLNLKSARSPRGKNTFYSKSEKRYWQFLDKQELKKCFDGDFKILYYKEKLIREKGHDELSKYHYHGIAEIVAKK